MDKPDERKGAKRAVKRPKGRPAKPAGEKAVTHALKFPPALWAELEALVPRGQRSAFIHRAMARELRALRRQIEKTSEKSEE